MCVFFFSCFTTRQDVESSDYFYWMKRKAEQYMMRNLDERNNIIPNSFKGGAFRNLTKNATNLNTFVLTTSTRVGSENPFREL